MCVASIKKPTKTKMPRVMSPGQEVLRSNCVARPVSHHAKFVSRL